MEPVNYQDTLSFDLIGSLEKCVEQYPSEIARKEISKLLLWVADYSDLLTKENMALLQTILVNNCKHPSDDINFSIPELLKLFYEEWVDSDQYSKLEFEISRLRARTNFIYRFLTKFDITEPIEVVCIDPSEEFEGMYYFYNFDWSDMKSIFNNRYSLANVPPQLFVGAIIEFIMKQLAPKTVRSYFAEMKKSYQRAIYRKTKYRF